MDTLESIFVDNWPAVVVAVIAVLAVLWLGVVVWTYRDMRARTQDVWAQAVSVLLVAFFHLPGLILYLLLRPHETLADAYDRRLEAEVIKQELTEQRRVCPACQRKVKEDFLVCPHCRAKLQEACSGCGRALDSSWAACPYCGAQVAQAAPVAATPTAATAPAPPPPPAPKPLTSPAGPPPPEPEPATGTTAEDGGATSGEDAAKKPAASRSRRAKRTRRPQAESPQ